MHQQLTLSELNEQIKDTLYDAFPATVWVVAEISELKVNRSGHCYLDLVEKKENEIVSRMRAMIWSYTFRMLKPYFETTTNTPFASGIKVLFQVMIEFHTAYGISLNIKDIDPTYTVGDMTLQRQEVINRLKQEGVFEMNKELALPVVPQKIAIISSKTAAGYEDFMKQLQSNDDFVFYTQLFEAYMQGSAAVSSIISALERIYQYEDFFDVVVIIRGGGAVADMSCFDDYELAFNITQFPLPVITGIGHEKDNSIADFVAHTRMKTPTAVADFLVNGITTFAEKLADAEIRLKNYADETLQQQREYLTKVAESVHLSTLHFITNSDKSLMKLGNKAHQEIKSFVHNENKKLSHVQHLADKNIFIHLEKQSNNLHRYNKILQQTATAIVENQQQSLSDFTNRLQKITQQHLLHQKDKLHLYENSVRLLDPINVLQRGYTISTVGKRVVKSVDEVKMNDEITIHFKDGVTITTVKNKRRDGKKENTGKKL